LITAVWQILFQSLGAWPWAAFVPCYAIAQLRGDTSGRGLASLLAISATAGFLMTEDAAPAHSAMAIEQAQLGLDFVFLTVLVFIALRSERSYPIVIASAQLLGVMLDIIAASRFAVRPDTQTALLSGVSLMQMSALGYGLVAHRSRRPFWRRRNRSENRGAELAPRANSAR